MVFVGGQVGENTIDLAEGIIKDNEKLLVVLELRKGLPNGEDVISREIVEVIGEAQVIDAL